MNGVEDDIDAALTDLQVSLEGSHIYSHNDILRVPDLSDYLRFLKYLIITFITQLISLEFFKVTKRLIFPDQKNSPSKRTKRSGSFVAICNYNFIKVQEVLWYK